MAENKWFEAFEFKNNHAPAINGKNLNMLQERINQALEEVYQKAAATVPKIDIKIVDVLPSENISTTSVYLVKSSESNVLFSEYMYVNEEWIYLGDQEFDVSEFVTESELQAAIYELTERIDKLEDNAVLRERLEQLEEEVEILNSEFEPNTVHGEIVTIKNGVPKSKVEVQGDGNSYQETREGYNLLQNTLESQTIDGLTAIVNKDKSVTINGTATKNTYLVLQESFTLLAGTYKMSGCPSGGSVDTYRLQLYLTGNSQFDEGNGKTFTLTEDTEFTSARIGFASGVTVSNLTFKPMVVENVNADKEYQPFGSMPSSDYPSDIEVIDTVNLLQVNEPYWGLTDKGIKNLAKNSGFKLTKSNITLKANTIYYFNFLMFSKPSQDTSFIGYVDSVESGLVSFAKLQNMDINTIYSKTYTPKKDEALTITMWGNANSETFEFQYWITTQPNTPYLPYGYIGLLQRNKNWFDVNNKIAVENQATYTIIDTTKVRLTCKIASTSSCVLKIADITKYVGKTFSMRADMLPSAQNKGRYILGVCNEDGTQRTTGKELGDTTGQIISYTIPEITNEQKYLAIWLYSNIGGTVVVGDYVDYSNIEIVLGDTIDGDYVEHQENLIPINLNGNTLAKVGNIKDLLNIGVDGSVSIEKKNIFDSFNTFSSSNLFKNSTYADNNIQRYTFINNGTYIKHKGASVPCLCTHFKNTQARWGTPTETGFFNWENNNAYGLDLPLDQYDTVTKVIELLNSLEDFKIATWLQTSETIQLPSIEPIKLFEGTNNFELVTNLDTTLGVTYKVSNKARLDALENAVLSLGGLR